MKRTLVALIGVLMASHCFAVGLDARAEGATLYVNNEQIVTLKTGTSGYTPEMRAHAAAVAIGSSFGLKVLFGVDEGIGRITISDRKILTVSSEEAKAQGKSVHALTNEIGDRLQGVLADVGFIVTPKQVWMPTGGSLELSLIGPLASKVNIKSSSTGVVTAVRDGEKIILKSNASGSAILTLTAGNEVEDVTVNVLVPAATIGIVGEAIVVGRPADKVSVENAITRAVRSAITCDQFAEVEVRMSAPMLVPAQRSAVPVKVSVRAPGKFPVETDLIVETKNIGPLVERTEELWYSNDPEVLKAPARLYWARLTEGGAARVLYHHQNMAGHPLKLIYSLINTADEVSRVSLMLGDAAPHKNPTYAGYMAGQEFFPRWVTGAATVIDIPPHSTLPIVIIGMKPNQTASGLMALHHISGPQTLLIGDCERTQIEGIAQSNVAHLQPARDLAQVTINLAGSPQHVYSPAEKSLEVQYEVGGRFGYARIGQVPVERVDDKGGLSGNFGILYKIAASVSNPTDKAVDIEIIFEASAGYGGAYFRINGSIVKTPLLQPKESHRILKVRLLPKDKKTFYLETIPLSGGSYPVTLTIKPVGIG